MTTWDPLTKTLARIAFGGALITTAFGVFTKKEIRRAYEDLQFYKDAVALLTTNKQVQNYLGEPIKVFGVDPADKDTSVTDDYCNVSVPVQGTKTGGILYIQAVNDGKVPPSAVLKSVEFEMKNPKGRIKLL